MAAALSYTQRGGPGQTWKSMNKLLPGETRRPETTQIKLAALFYLQMNS